MPTPTNPLAVIRMRSTLSAMKPVGCLVKVPKYPLGVFNGPVPKPSATISAVTPFVLVAEKTANEFVLVDRFVVAVCMPVPLLLDPSTCNVTAGVVVPMPTLLPLCAITEF